MFKGKIFSGSVSYVLCLPNGLMKGFSEKPKAIPGGYIDQYGHRYISNEKMTGNKVDLIPNDWRFVTRY